MLFPARLAAVTATDFVVLVLYIGGIVGMGVWFSKRSRNTGEFMAAGRSLPGWVVGLSILGTYVSSISFLANPGKSYTADWNPFVFGISLPIAAWLATRFFVPYYRESGYVSAYANLEDRFGPWARVYASVFYMLTQVARVGTILYLVALALSALTGVDIALIIVATGVLVIIYTVLGGIEAVIWTDVVQSVVLIFGILLSIALLMMNMPGGAGEIFAVASAEGKFSLGSFSASLQQSTFWVVLVYGLFINLQNFGIDQTYIQRYITARDTAAAKRSVWIGAIAYIPVSALLFFVGTALFAYYGAQPELLPAAADGFPIGGDKVFPHFIATEMPPGITGLLVAAILAAAMSSVDSSLNSSATLILTDFYKRYKNPDADERASMRVLYTATCLFGVLGTAMALWMIGAKSALDQWWKFAGIFSGGMLGLFLLGIVSRRAGNAAAVTAVLAGLSVILYLSLANRAETIGGVEVQTPFHSSLTIVFGTCAIFFIGLLVAMFMPRRESPKT